MDDTKKMLKAIINGQSAMKQELIGEIRKVDKKVEILDQKTTENFKKVNERLDKLGKSLAYLEDDTPTRDEYDGLEGRVGKLEHKIAAV